jgi:hypothetical protein
MLYCYEGNLLNKLVSDEKEHSSGKRSCWAAVPMEERAIERNAYWRLTFPAMQAGIFLSQIKSSWDAQTVITNKSMIDKIL